MLKSGDREIGLTAKNEVPRLRPHRFIPLGDARDEYLIGLLG